MNEFDVDFFANDSFCHYLDLQEFSYLKNNHRLGNLSVLNTNIRSLRKHFTDLQSFLHSCDCCFAIIVITETWLNSDYDNMFHLEGYNFLSLCREECFGGVRIYYKDCLKLQLIKEDTYINNACEILTVQISFENKEPINIFCIYRPPKCSLLDFNEFLRNLINVKYKDRRCIIVGDLNANFFDVDTAANFNLFSILFEQEYRLLITKGTHLQGNRINSLIDHIITNLATGYTSVVFNHKIADHLPNAAFIELEELSFRTYPIKFRDFSEKNINCFLIHKSALFNNFFNSNIVNNNNINNAITKLMDFTINICNKYFPIKNKNLGSVRFKSPWIDKKLLKCINKQNNLFNLYLKGKISEKIFNNFKLLVEFATEQSKKIYYDNKFSHVKNSGDSWKIIKSLYGPKKSGSEDTYTDIDGSKLTESDKIADAFNAYFISIPHKTINYNNNQTAINKDEFLHLIPNNINSIFMNPTSPEEVIKVINSLNNNSNLSDIPLKFIKLTAYEYSIIMTHLINLIFESGEYPDIFKIAEIHPIPKKKPSTSIVNNRPISILLIFDKVLEKIMHERYYRFFIKYSIISESQFGFITNKGTDLAILKLLDYLYPGFSNCLYMLCLFIDFTKAFDCIQHCLLLAKLWRYGIRGIAYKLIKSFLTNRKQYVIHKNHKSFFGEVHIGVPQGSCLGPLLFVVFVNDLYYLLRGYCNIVQYADDTALVKSGKDIYQLIDDMNVILCRLQRWCKCNSLCLNIDKTKAMVLTLCNVGDLPFIEIDNKIIEYATDFKYLGVQLDCKLSFNYHINILCKKMSMMAGISYNISKYLTLGSTINFYYAFIFSLLSYCITAWGGNLSKEGVKVLIERRHKKIVRNLFGKFGNCNYDYICKKYSLLKIEDIYKYFLGLLAFKTFKKYIVTDLSNHICCNNNDIHNYDTRFKPEIRLPTPRIEIIRNGYIYNALKVWNNLSCEVKSASNISLFKKRLKKYFIDKY